MNTRKLTMLVTSLLLLFVMSACEGPSVQAQATATPVDFTIGELAAQTDLEVEDTLDGLTPVPGETIVIDTSRTTTETNAADAAMQGVEADYAQLDYCKWAVDDCGALRMTEDQLAMLMPPTKQQSFANRNDFRVFIGHGDLLTNSQCQVAATTSYADLVSIIEGSATFKLNASWGPETQVLQRVAIVAVQAAYDSLPKACDILNKDGVAIAVVEPTMSGNTLTGGVITQIMSEDEDGVREYGQSVEVDLESGMDNVNFLMGLMLNAGISMQNTAPAADTAPIATTVALTTATVNATTVPTTRTVASAAPTRTALPIPTATPTTAAVSARAASTGGESQLDQDEVGRWTWSDGSPHTDLPTSVPVGYIYVAQGDVIPGDQDNRSAVMIFVEGEDPSQFLGPATFSINSIAGYTGYDDPELQTLVQSIIDACSAGADDDGECEVVHDPLEIIN